MKKIITLFFLLTLFCNSFSQNTEQVYAGVVFHILKYVEWPAYNDPTITIGIINNSKLRKALNKVSFEKKIHFKDIEAVDCNDLDDVSEYYALFFSKNSLNYLSKLNAQIKENNILTISEKNNEKVQGLAINIIEKEGRTKIELYLNTLDKTKLKVSEQLKKIADLK